MVAATGVGAGDLATGAIAGRELGLACLWAALLGAGLKFVLNEGLARYQLVTGETLLAGAVRRLGRPVRWFFPLYLLPWSYFVGAALISACGVTLHALVPIFEDAQRGKQVFGAACSLAGLVLVWRGGYRLFERVMAVSIGTMFVTVLVCALLLRPDAAELVRGGLVPRVPPGGWDWTMALLGGVGGTLTVLCYGYWIREEGREGPGALGLTRVDLAVGYAVTAVFGLAMVVIGSHLGAEGSGARLVVGLGEQLGARLGPVGRWAFLVGAFGAVFSSLLGVWQAVPYLFTDFVQLARGENDTARPIDVRSPLYRGYLIGLALVPLVALFQAFERVQKVYAIVGACFLPLLALVLLRLNGRRGPLGAARNRFLTVALLLMCLALFAFYGWQRVLAAWG